MWAEIPTAWAKIPRAWAKIPTTWAKIPTVWAEIPTAWAKIPTAWAKILRQRGPKYRQRGPKYQQRKPNYRQRAPLVQTDSHSGYLGRKRFPGIWGPDSPSCPPLSSRIEGVHVTYRTDILCGLWNSDVLERNRIVAVGEDVHHHLVLGADCVNCLRFTCM